MNIILFEEHEIGSPLKRDDRRAVHVLEVLRRRPGDATDIGIVNGPRGKAVLKSIGKDEVVFEFALAESPAPLLPIDLIVGLSRPQTCRRILQEATSLGVRRIVFVLTERGEPSYATSRLWTTGEWERLVRAGVEQAFSTRFPVVEFGVALTTAIASMCDTDRRVCLDNYEATGALLETLGEPKSVVLAIGSERGWTGGERRLFRESGFILADLGPRPQRTETATIAAVSIVSAVLRKPT